jgi:protein involved in polysaccharide export with SLBB domain
MPDARRATPALGILLAMLSLALTAAPGGVPAAQAAPVSLGRLFELPPAPSATELRSASVDSGAGFQSSPGSLLLAGPVDPETYILGPGDVLSLERASMAGIPQLLQVDAEGALYLSDLGRYQVAGVSLARARREILAALRPFLPRTRVDLRLVKPRSFKVFLLGETPSPGPVVATAAHRAVEAVLVHGTLPAGTSQRNIRLVRTSGVTLRVDIQSFLLYGDQSNNPLLADGDRLILPVLRDRVLVSGSVERGGNFELAPGDSFSTLLRLAGGLSPGANGDSVLIVRFRGATSTESLWLSVIRDAALPLQADDRIFVRTRQPYHPMATVSVEGEVLLPGLYPVHEGYDRLSGLLGHIGGFTPRASLGNVVLERGADPAHIDDPGLERLRRLTRSEMTQTEYADLRMRTDGRGFLYRLDLSQPLAPGSGEDVLLRGGDRLLVGSLARTVRVGGAVVRPGLIDFRPEIGPQDYVEQAGGFGNRADRSEIRVIRSGDGKSLPAREVDRLSPGDFVWVPEKPDKPAFWGAFKDILSVTTQLVTAILVIRSYTK